MSKANQNSSAFWSYIRPENKIWQIIGFFSNNTSEEKKNEVLNILGLKQDTQHSKYLGLPSIIG